MNSASRRIFLAAAAGALSMLLFHQTTLQVFYWLGLAPSPAFRLAVVPPFGVPHVVSACFWAALIAAPCGILHHWSDRRAWITAMPLGVIGVLLIWFVVLPLKGQPVAYGWQIPMLIRSATAGLMWGLGVGIILPRLLPRHLTHRGQNPNRKSWSSRHIPV